MPQPKWYGKSLAGLCMDNIVDNMEKWTASRSSELVSCHFYHLPYHCLEYMTENHCLTEDMFDLLLNPHTKVLDLLDSYLLPDFSPERNLRICGLASVRCSQLTTLKINEGCQYYLNEKRNSKMEETFSSMLQLFEHLQILDLSFTIYGASCMLNLGSTCKPKISELLVQRCPGVTDSVMQVFCNGQSSLQKLSVRQTAVTLIGIRFAIEHLPELEELDCDNDSDILNVFRSIRNEKRESKKFSLTKLSMFVHDKVPYEKGSVSLMVDMCPTLVDLFRIGYGEEFTNEELLDFRELKLIKSLTISDESSICFRGGVLPLLQARGLTLETLALSVEVTSEEAYVIIECCPNIRDLTLVLKSNYRETPGPVVDGVYSSYCSPKEVIPLRKLEEIYLSNDIFFAISRELLLLLLSSPALTYVCIRKCFTLDDQIIEEAFTKNKFKYLTILKFLDCSNVSQKGIDFFLNETNPLCYIYVEGCGNVNFDRLKMMVKEKHWNIKFLYNDEDDEDVMQ
ncbi:uncharacterized protein LOC124189402 [Daphnia pulex]|uniref:uncharacterized protein LOC124189402 n=1 Tax=Daphnia pulex TaxID=6669 RepID=UPI001EDE9CC8|nr:uncharacterized protein LOC124189402 [Daphnia pulex]